MLTTLLIDTDILIDYLRGYKKAIQFLESSREPLLLSVINIAELYAGIRDNREQMALEQFLQVFDVIDLDNEIAKLAGRFRRDYSKSHGTGLADALIAATAIS